MVNKSGHQTSSHSSIYETASTNIVFRDATDIPNDTAALEVVRHGLAGAVALRTGSADAKVVSDMKKLSFLIGASQKRYTRKLGHVKLSDIKDDLAGLLEAEFSLKSRPQISHLQKDINEFTLPRTELILRNRDDVTLSFLFQRGQTMHPGRWHIDSHIIQGRFRILRAVSDRGPDISSRWNRSNERDVQDFVSTPVGLCVFDGKNIPHRTPAISQSDAEVFRAAYVLT